MQKNNSVLLNVEQMAAADRLAVKAGGTGIQLMENAGQAVMQEIIKRFMPRCVAVLCGPGNNGGDGFVIARLLVEQGWEVKLGLLCRREELKGDALHHSRLWKGKVEPVSPALLEGAELVVDALFGAGLTRPLEGAALETLAAADRKAIPVVAVDIPSGIMGDTGETTGAAKAVLTVTFFRKKPGHLLHPGRAYCGEVIVADIGISSSVLEHIAPATFENTPFLWQDALPHLAVDANKYSRGSALLYGGYPMTGASRLAARACARAGSGLTTIACSEKAFPIYAAALESVIVKPLAPKQSFKDLLADKRYSAVLIGPGAGDAIKPQVIGLLASAVPTVLDADAVSVFRGDITALKNAISGPCVMTPHEGEFKRVFDVTGDKLTRARAAAQHVGAVIVLKGNDTVIAAPDGRAAINAIAPAVLATAGAGDVLAGIITGLLAQGMDAFRAACAAVWLHGQAASFFGRGLVAEDIPDLLPQAWAALEENS